MRRKGPTKAHVFVAMTSNQHNILYLAERCTKLLLQTLYTQVLIKSKKVLESTCKIAEGYGSSNLCRPPISKLFIIISKDIVV